MKKATEYGNKIKKALPGMKKKFSPKAPPELEPLEVFVLGVLRQDTTLKKAVKALKLLQEEFVDFNEMRVAPGKDIIELLGSDIPGTRAKADQITAGLNRIFDHENRLDFEHVAEMGKRELRAHLRDALGLNSYVEAYLLLYLFGDRAIPVDSSLFERMKADELVHPDSDIDDVRTVLERVVAAKDQAQIFETLTMYGTEKAKAKKTSKPKAAKKAATKTAKKTTKKSEPTVAKKTAKKAKKTAVKKAEPKTTTKKAAAKTAKKTAKKAVKKTTTKKKVSKGGAKKKAAKK